MNIVLVFIIKQMSSPKKAKNRMTVLNEEWENLLVITLMQDVLIHAGGYTIIVPTTRFLG